MTETHHVVLTRGSLLVTTRGEEKIMQAVRDGVPLVDVWTVTKHEGPTHNRFEPTMLATAHVMMTAPLAPAALAEAKPPPEEPPWRGTGSFAIAMSKPTATSIRGAAVATIREAIMRREKIVRLESEAWAESEALWPITIVVAHIISITEIPKRLWDIVDEAGPGVVRIRNRT